MSLSTVSTSATMVSAKAEPKVVYIKHFLGGDFEPKVLSGNLENFTKENMGAFLGKGGDKLKKFVTVKSAIMVKDAYKKDFGRYDSSWTKPEELGSVLIKVKIEGENEYHVSIHNQKENLDKYLEIVMKNLFTHAKNCTKKRVVENKYRNKIAFVAKINHEGLIGKFVGSGGKKIKMLTNNVKQALNVQDAHVSIKPISECGGISTWRNKKIRIKTESDNDFEVQITVAVNLPEELFKDFKKTLQILTPIINKSVLDLEEPKDDYADEICADDFLLRGGTISNNFTPSSPQYIPSTPEKEEEEEWGPSSPRYEDDQW